MHYFPGPLKSLDEILPGRTAKRDLPADLAKALGKRGMKLFLYYHLGAHDDPEFLKASRLLGNRHHQVLQQLAEDDFRGRPTLWRQLAGWWFDDGSTNYYYRSAPWEALAKAAKAGFPQRFISFNAWEMNNPTEFHDFCTGEACYDPRGIDALLTPANKGIYPSGTHAGLPASACLISDSNWVHTSPNTPPSGPKWNADQLTELLNKLHRPQERPDLQSGNHPGRPTLTGEHRHFQGSRWEIALTSPRNSVQHTEWLKSPMNSARIFRIKTSCPAAACCCARRQTSWSVGCRPGGTRAGTRLTMSLNRESIVSASQPTHHPYP